MKVLLLILLLATQGYAQTASQSFSRARARAVTPKVPKLQAYEIRGKTMYFPRMSKDTIRTLNSYGKVKNPSRNAPTQGRASSAAWSKKHTPSNTYWNYRKGKFDRPKPPPPKAKAKGKKR